MKTSDALVLAQSKGLDLIEISPTAKPPVTRIYDFGKYQYQEEKNARQAARKQKEVETKGIRIGIGTSSHDLELKAKKTDAWLAKGHRIQVEIRLRGREKGSKKEFIQERVDRFLELVQTKHKIAEPLKRARIGYAMIVEKI